MITKQNAGDLLFSVGISPSLKGFQYIIDAVLLYEQDTTQPITNIYVDVASKHKAQPTSVERAIRHAFSKMDRKSEKVIDIFGKYASTNKEYVAIICWHLREREGK
jgi:hypothetical protein